MSSTSCRCSSSTGPSPSTWSSPRECPPRGGSRRYCEPRRDQGGSVVMPEAALRAQDVVVRFGGLQALDRVSLDVLPGQIRGLIGPNGAGKTTLFDVLSGTTAPTSGSIFLGGADVTNRSATWRARHGLRRTFQRQQVFGSLPVEDNVLTAAEWRGGGGGLPADLLSLPGRRRRGARRRELVGGVLRGCGLSELRN